ncbi:heavy metal-associated isoprenylated plant protein 6-like isoform X2 [Rhodamnia argentea]|uniref:Heavy metal-associated isoprenylated plant protein 6-like isoform X2 n=1 Tax=Rhodamnia argentea TaxID=178133 RepID=A0A8B8NI01_9MYRT|nr:heavy metal-associated isoprenylated plant protein 6-like isoform X2 [Rhodamnia argentea]
MGEKEGAKNEGDQKDDGNVAVVLKMDMHCDGCAKKVRRAVRSFDGVEDVKVDTAANKLTVTGKVDPTKIKEKLEEKTKKKVEIVSPQPKKDGGGGDKKPEEKPEKKTEDKKAEDKKPKETTVVFKIRTHCDGCIKKIKKIVSKINGVNAVSIDGAKDLVVVTGMVDPKELTPYLREKLRRSVEVVPPPPAKKDASPPPAKTDDGASDKKEKEGGGEKKDKEAGGGGGDKKEKEAAAGGGEKKAKGESKKEDGGSNEAPKMEMSKMEYPGYSAPPPMYWQGGPSYAQSYGYDYSHARSYAPNYAHNYAVEPYNYHAGYANQGYPTHYVNEGYGMPMDQRLHPMDPRLNPPQMFSDENPNACSVM